MDRVFLSQSFVSCTGGPRDEKLVREVANAMEQFQRKSMLLKDPGVSRVGKRVLDIEDTLAKSGREFHDSGALSWNVMQQQLEGIDATGSKALRSLRADQRMGSMPRQLPQNLASAVQRAVGAAAVLNPLQMDTKGMHLQQRGAAGSVQADQLADWFRSESGKAWLETREKLFNVDDGVNM